MVKSGVMSARINQVGKAHLRNSSKSLEIGMTYEVENKCAGNSNKSVNWIIEYFEFVRPGQNTILCAVNIRSK